ncbi:MAG: vitamin K epoxide reductase family protein [Sediminibacterium sp.]|nr:vitamin K epoxide reductase family protein [Sediminibacterium sp.]
MNIISKLTDLLSPLHNCESTTINFCEFLKVAVTKTTIKKQLEDHPDYPSLLSVSEVLNSFGVDNLATKITAEQISKLHAPMIVQLSIGREKYFSLVMETTESTITYIDPVSNKKNVASQDEFSSIFTGYLLLAEASDNAGEKEYKKHLHEEQRKVFAKISAVIAVPLVTLLSIVSSFNSNGLSVVPAIVYTLLTLGGTMVGSLLLWYEVDQHNPALQQICSAGKKTNCSTILNSKASKVFGISWSIIGYTYFTGSLISLLVTNIYHLQVLFILAWLNVIALPYIIFSIYYQAKIAKEWCVLCLTVQAILALQYIVAFWGGLHFIDKLDSINAANVSVIIISFLIPFLLVSLLLPALNKAKESSKNKIELQRLKHNTQIFEALLVKQKAIIEPSGLGISIGNPNAKFKLIKVCNPYCGPCAKAHPAMEELVHNNSNIRVQILFTATGEDGDYKTLPARHLLAIAEKGDEKITKQALDDWYLAEEKSYQAFAAKYPMNGELKKQTDKMKAMDEWCNKTNIEFTPTFFVNGYQLPKIYSVSDLKYFLSV